jgi:DNA-binding transcriptional LysR family regulator
VVREGSFSAAGRQLGLSPAAVARSCSGLEDSLGARLLARNSRRLSLTEAGQSFHDRIRPLVEEIQQAADHVSHYDEEASGPLRVHCRIVVGTLILAPALRRFFESFPDIDLTLLMSNDQAVDMIGENIDVDVQVGRREDSSLRARLLSPGGSVLCASPAYLAEHAAPTRPEEVAGHACLAYQYATSKPIWSFHAPGGEVTDVRIDARLRTDNGVALHAALHQGLGLALLPHWAVADDLKSGRLVACLPELEVRHSGYGNAVYALYHQSRARSLKVRVFLDFLVELFADARAAAAASPRIYRE